MSYLMNLTLRLSTGVAGLPEAMRDRHAASLTAAQHDDGGFAGRKGAGDLYYTSFALRSLAMLGVLDDRTAARAAAFLKRELDRPLSGIDVFADVGRDRRQAVIDFVEFFRRPDGGYAKTPRGGQGSTYHTFLVAVCKEIVGIPLDGTQQMIELVRSRQREDGGFVEVAPMRQGGTNPTAAAVGLLKMLDALDEPTRTTAGRFLAGMQTAEGGLRANTRIPVADLLSTFTGLVALSDLDAASAVDAAAALRFVERLQQPGGGFRAGAFDDAVDVEYTFYGLGALALLTQQQG